MDHFFLAYIFTCFSVGLLCVGSIFVFAKQSSSPVANSFLFFYSFLMVSVLSGLVLAFIDVSHDLSGTPIQTIFEYLESMVGFYGILITLPIFIHRVFAIDNPIRTRILTIVASIAFVGQHITEYGLDKWWDTTGDWLENVLFIGICVYLLVVGTQRFNMANVDRVQTRYVLAFLVFSTPALMNDLFFIESTGLRFYPLLFAVLSVAIAWHLFTHSKTEAATPNVLDHSVPAEWNLTERESEVVARLLDGHSNKEIGTLMYISVSTVKTHLRSVFEKSGCRSRFEVMSAVSAARKKA